MIIYIVKFAIHILVCLFIFILMYDHCVLKKSLGSSLKDRTLQIFLSPLLWQLVKLVLLVAIFYLIYTLMHDNSLF